MANKKHTKSLVNFAKRSIGWRDIRVKWLLCYCAVLIIALVVASILHSRTLSKTRVQISRITVSEKTLLAAMKKRFGDKHFVGILNVKNRNALQGYTKYLTAIGEITLTDLWVNNIELLGEPVQITISGETFEANNVQYYYTQLQRLGPFINAKLRVSEFSGLREKTEREKKRIEQLKRRGKKVETSLDLEKTFRFTITNVKEKEKKKRRRR